MIDRDTNSVAKRLQERLVAARMAIPFLQKAELGRVPQLPPGVKRLSINEMAAFAVDDAEQSDVNNLKNRYWVPSQPVIHLAAATAVVGQELRKANVVVDLDNILLCREIVRRAELYEKLIANDPDFPVKAEKLIRVQLAS